MRRPAAAPYRGGRRAGQGAGRPLPPPLAGTHSPPRRRPAWTHRSGSTTARSTRSTSTTSTWPSSGAAWRGRWRAWRGRPAPPTRTAARPWPGAAATPAADPLRHGDGRVTSSAPPEGISARTPGPGRTAMPAARDGPAAFHFPPPGGAHVHLPDGGRHGRTDPEVPGRDLLAEHRRPRRRRARAPPGDGGGGGRAGSLHLPQGLRLPGPGQLRNVLQVIRSVTATDD